MGSKEDGHHGRRREGGKADGGGGDVRICYAMNILHDFTTTYSLDEAHDPDHINKELSYLLGSTIALLPCSRDL